MLSADDSLAAHGRRRAALVPTISVLVGDEATSLGALQRWAMEQRRPLFCVEGRSEEEGRQTLLNRLLRQPNIEAQALAYLARDLERPAEEVQRSLASARERNLIQSSLDGLLPRASVAFALLTSQPVRQGWLLSENLAAAMELFAPAWPCLLIPGPRSSVACLRQVEAWVGAAPELSACLVLDAASWLHLESVLEGTRLLGVLREGLVSVERPPGKWGVNTSAPDRETRPTEPTDAERALPPEAAAAVLARDDSLPEELERARSAIEAFLFRLLELRASTVGLFELNVKLDFNHGAQRAEVDLLCASLRMALEVDGYHHFVDRAAVRRDRRKDLLLQRHGYVVMRILAEDVVPHMSSVLGDIEDVLAWRRQQVLSPP